MIYVQRLNMIGTHQIDYTAWEHARMTGTHSTITFRDGNVFGQIGTRDLPAEITRMPRGEERSRAVALWHQAQADEAYEAITQAYPHLEGHPVHPTLSNIREVLDEKPEYTNDWTPVAKTIEQRWATDEFNIEVK